MPARIGGEPTRIPEGLTPQEFARLFRMTPQAAVDFLAGRADLKTTYDWRTLWHDEHAHQFTVSRLTQLDLLKSLYEGLVQSVQGDLSRRDWSRNMEALLTKSGWWGTREVVDPDTGAMLKTRFDPNRLKLIYDTNVRMAHAAGRWERFEQSRATHPYVRYLTKGDGRVRASHATWNHLTLPMDHPFWETHFPPNGWRCRCRAMAMSQADYDRGSAPDGSPLAKQAPPEDLRPWVDTRTGEQRLIPVGIDPGFDFNVGVASARARESRRLAQAKQAAAPAPVAQALAALPAEALPPPQTLDDYLAQGAALSARLPDGGTDPEACYRELLAALRTQVPMDAQIKTASRGTGAALVKQASQLYPDSWIQAADALGPLSVRSGKKARGWALTLTREGPRRLPGFGQVQGIPGAGYIEVRSGDLACAVHELAHRIQAAVPELDRLFRQLHERRTRGDPLESLAAVTGKPYRQEEQTRKDSYIDPYQGKEYENLGPLEVMTMAFESVLGYKSTDRRDYFRRIYRDDREMFDLVIGLLFRWSP